MKSMSRGGKRKGAGRKPGPFKKRYWMLRIQKEHAAFITQEARKRKMPIGDFVAASVFFALKKERLSL
jgi:hypothetical protein